MAHGDATRSLLVLGLFDSSYDHKLNTDTTMKNCAFQYAKIATGFFRRTEIVCDKSELTLEEAKQLWNKYYADCAQWIKDGNDAEMVIWINMVDAHSYFDTLEYISTDAESDGLLIWETKKEYFTKQFEV